MPIDWSKGWESFGTAQESKSSVLETPGPPGWNDSKISSAICYCTHGTQFLSAILKKIQKSNQNINGLVHLLEESTAKIYFIKITSPKSRKLMENRGMAGSGI